MEKKENVKWNQVSEESLRSHFGKPTVVCRRRSFTGLRFRSFFSLSGFKKHEVDSSNSRFGATAGAQSGFQQKLVRHSTRIKSRTPIIIFHQPQSARNTRNPGTQQRIIQPDTEFQEIGASGGSATIIRLMCDLTA